MSSAIASREANSADGASVEPWGQLFRVQRLFHQGPYHQVHDDTAQEASTPAALEGAEAALRRQLHELAKVTAREEETRLRRIAGPAVREVNDWARRAGFARRLQGYEWVAARGVCDKPFHDQHPIAFAVWHLSGLMLNKCHYMACRAGEYVLELVNRTRPGQAPSKKLHCYADGTVHKHARTIQACLGFFVLTQLEPAMATVVPAYKVSSGVAVAWSALHDSLLSDDGRDAVRRAQGTPGSHTEAERLVLRLFVALLEQEGDFEETTQLPLIVALTVLSIVPGKQEFRQPRDYSSMLSGFSKMARYALLAFIRNLCKDNALLAVESCLVRGPNNAMNWALRTMNVAMDIAHATPSQGRLHWIPHEEAYLYNEHKLSLGQLRAIVHGALAEQTRVLCADLLFVDSPDELPAIPWDRIVDRRDHEARGSAWTDSANRLVLAAGDGWLLNRVAETQHARFLCERRQALQSRAVTQFKEGMLRFAEEGMPLAAWAVGMPIRGTTITDYRWRNSDSGTELRNLVVQDGRLTLVGGHSKVQWRGLDAPLHVLPREVANVWG
ncbi:hypothetical protein NX059_012154 [Plenodomus lindquistii]|nr:hypothetical protein NX059_012154 [Plenodomus lindquistii]